MAIYTCKFNSAEGKEGSGDNSELEAGPRTRPAPSPTATTRQVNNQRVGHTHTRTHTHTLHALIIFAQNHTFFTKTLMRIETCQVVSVLCSVLYLMLNIQLLFISARRRSDLEKAASNAEVSSTQHMYMHTHTHTHTNTHLQCTYTHIRTHTHTHIHIHTKCDILMYVHTVIDCRSLCHPECKGKVPLPCVPSVPTPKKIQVRFRSSFLHLCAAVYPPHCMVPLLLAPFVCFLVFSVCVHVYRMQDWLHFVQTQSQDCQPFLSTVSLR